MDATFEQLSEVEDIGDQMAGSVLRYFERTENREMMERFLQYGISGTIQEETLQDETGQLGQSHSSCRFAGRNCQSQLVHLPHPCA